MTNHRQAGVVAVAGLAIFLAHAPTLAEPPPRPFSTFDAAKRVARDAQENRIPFVK